MVRILVPRALIYLFSSFCLFLFVSLLFFSLSSSFAFLFSFIMVMVNQVKVTMKMRSQGKKSVHEEMEVNDPRFPPYFKEFDHCHKLSCSGTVCNVEQEVGTVVIELTFSPHVIALLEYHGIKESISFISRTSFNYKLCDLEQAIKISFILSFFIWKIGMTGSIL